MYGNANYEDEAVKRDKSISKTLVKADSKVKENQKRYDYWMAVYIDFGNGHGTYKPQTPLSFSQAISYNRRGGNIIASSKRNAYKLAGLLDMEAIRCGMTDISIKMVLRQDIEDIIMMDYIREDIFFMCKLEYMDLQEKYLEIIKYCLKFSDSFSVITTMKKAYSEKIYIPEHNEVLKEWEFCLVQQRVGIKEWPGTRTNAKRKVMNIYNARKFRTTIEDIPNFFSPVENNLPEDICFYRGKEPWFITVSHEKLIFLDSPTSKDLQYFSEKGVRVYGV